jgi:hypothetical protein
MIDKSKLDISDVDEQGNVIPEPKVEAVPEVELNMYIYSNNGHDAPAESLLRLFYEGALQNTIGVMRARVGDTDETALLLVGVAPKEGGGTQVYPLARILGQEDVANLKSPDGKGGWFDPEQAANS